MNTQTQLPRAVYLVDDDESVLNSIGCMLTVSGLHVEKYSAGDLFLSRVDTELSRHRSTASWPHQDCCVVLDINMPRVSGTAVFERIASLGLTKKMPVIFMTGHGDVALAVSLVKAGAFNFLEKPANPDKLIEMIGYALDASASALLQAKEATAEQERWDLLTKREKDVMQLAKKGFSNVEISAALNISVNTTKAHRLAARSKLGIRSVVDLHQKPSGLWEKVSDFGPE